MFEYERSVFSALLKVRVLEQTVDMGAPKVQAHNEMVRCAPDSVPCDLVIEVLSASLAG